ncbi:MAG: acetyl-CoA C-acyltransferase [Chitinophagales bacterium]|jgi:acetyl-CoA C-acetyltransferase|nr:acetyl-CoA C-acyltransferase [Chitinophagales bacterium]
MNEVYIVSMARTAIGSFNGTLAPLSAVQMGAAAIKEAVKRAGIDPNTVNEVFMGNVLQANNGQAPARQAALAAGLPVSVACTTINKVCASGMKAIMLATQSIMLGDNDIVVAGGMESMSNAPYYLTNNRWGARYGNGELIDAIVRDGLQDPYKGYMMGNAGEVCAEKYQFSRQDQDAYATQSYKRAAEAYQNNYFADELMSIEVPSKKGAINFAADEEYKNIIWDKVPTLKPAFKKDGTITAVNASKINDGAAALVLMSKQKADELGIKPIARIAGYADAAQEPEWFTTTPAKAIPRAVSKAGWTLADVDKFEINEAFSVVALANIKEMNLDHEKVNVLGGAVALGHPVGVSGARIICTLISALKHKGGTRGAAGICNGGGGASAMAIELI